MKTVLKFGALAAVGVTAAVLAKRYNLVERGVALVDKGTEVAAAKADDLVEKVVLKVDALLSQFEENFTADDPTVEEEPSDNDPAPAGTLYGHSSYGDVR